MNMPKHYKNNINRLKNEISPYLQQHASNRIDWYAWGSEAFEKARIENKPIIISIGYSSCHWCHVMNRETFSDDEVAKIMNEHFISIKVDREERPDIDKIYMEALNLMQIQGGWPLNCFLLPDGSPFWGGTYFSLNDWKELLIGINKLFVEQKQRVLSHAQYLTNQLKTTNIKLAATDIEIFDTTLLHKIFTRIRLNLDFRDGGFAQSPKFPMPVNLLFHLRYGYLFGDDEALRHSLLSLKKIAMGGIFDHIGGGFSRYSTDIRWKIPHFEKMLYDNALLVSLYSEAYRLNKNNFFKQIITETLNFVQKEMMGNNFRFYSSVDADSESEEGKYYVWTREEINDILGQDAGIFCRFYGVGGEASWEDGKNVLIMHELVKSFADKHFLDYDDFNKTINKCRKKLFKYRNKRTHPFIDKKTLSSWNFLMLKAFADAYLATANKEYLNIAEKNADFVLTKLMKSDGGLYHIYIDDISKINAFLDDYAFAIEAFIALYSITYNKKYIFQAKFFVEYIFNNFEQDAQGMFLYSCNKDPLIIANKSENFDNILPSANSSIANSLYYLSEIFENTQWKEKSVKMLKTILPQIISNPIYYANWCILASKINSKNFLIKISGYDAIKKAFEINKNYYPSKIVIVNETKSKISSLKENVNKKVTKIGVCDEKKCFEPVNNVKEAIKIMKQNLRKFI